MLTSGGGVSCAPFESWNGNWVSVVGLAVSSTGIIYEAVFNGTAQNTIRSRTSIGATSTTFVSASALGVPSAGQGQITGMTIDASDNLYVTMRDLGEIKRITSAGVVTTYASGLGSPISSPVINPATNVLYYVNANKDIMQIPSGGGSPSLLTAASCNFETWNGSSWYGLGAQLAIDAAGFLYGAQCGGVTTLSAPNAEPITQINPSTGAMRQYLGWNQCAHASLTNGWAAGCGGNQALAFANGRLYTAGAHMDSAGVYGMNPSGYFAALTYTPNNSGAYSIGANLAPTDSGAFSASSGSGSLSVVPAAPQTPDLTDSSDLGASPTDNNTSDNTPRIEIPGTYTAGNTITVTASRSGATNVTCSYVIPATGCDLGTLSDGTWSISATDTHPTAGASAASSTLSVTVDTSRPTAPSGVDLLASSDTGASNTDNNTNDTTPTMSASGGTNGDTMTISATNGTTTVSCTYVIGSATNCTLPTLTDGTWNISSTLTDPAGNVSLASSGLPITIDTTGPQSLTPDVIASSDTGVSDADNVTNDSTPTITFTGQTTGDVITVNASNGVTTVSCGYTVGANTNCTLGALSDGTWTISASVTDAAGNTGTTQSLDISVDTTAPSAPSGVDLLAASDTGASNSDNNTNDTTPTLSASGGTNGDTMTISATNGTTTVSCTYVIGSATNCTLPTLTDGTWNISSTLTDPAGNISPSSTALPITIDGTAPAAPTGLDLLAASDTGASNSDNNTNDTTPTLSASGGTNGDTMTISATNGTTTVSCTYVIGSATNCTLPTLTDGTWNISSTLTDPAGNISPSSTALPITIDGTAPAAPTGLDLLSASDTGSSDSDNNTNDTTPTLSASGGTNGDTMTISATNGTTTVSCTYVIGAATNCTLPTLTDGTWNISSTLTDPLGNESAASSALPVTIATSSPSRSAPDLLATSDNGASNSDNITNDSTPEISIAGALAGDVVTVSATNGTATLTCTYTVGAATSCSLPTLSDGTWTVSASVTDAAGNTGPATGSLPITIDATAPSNPVAPDLATTSDNGGSQTDNVTTDTTPTFGMAGANDGDTITFTASDGKGNIRTCSYVHSTTVSSCEILTLSAGTWTVEAIVVDTAGNQSAKSPPTTLVIGSQPASSPLPTTGFKLPVDLIALWMLTFGIGLTVLHRSRKRLQIGN
jgi:hypothetical protein